MHRRHARWLLLFAPLMGCECGDATGLGLVDARLVVTPSAVDFGTIAAGTPESRPVQLVNLGPGVVTITQLDTDGSAELTLEGIELPLTLAANAELTLTVTYAPTRAGPHSATFGVVADDQEAPHPISARGAATEASVCVTPAFIPFSRGDGAGEQLVTITACGQTAVTIEALGFEASDDSLTFAADAPPFALEAGERRIVRIRHAPPDTTSAAGAVLTVVSSGTPATTTVVITASPEVVPAAAGRYIYYWQVVGESGAERSNIMRLALQEGSQPEVFWGNSSGNGCPGCHHVSPDGKYVALIVRNAGLSLIDTDTRQELKLPGMAEQADGMSWRPNVDTHPPYQLVYSAAGRLYKATARDGDLGALPNTATVTEPLRAHVMPSWSSDGRIAYVTGMATRRRSWALEGGADVMVIGEDGGIPVKLVGARGGTESSYYPAFSPDGRWLALTESTLGTTYSSPDARVVLVRSDGSGERQELPTSNTIGLSRCYPAWSLDGKYLGFSVSPYNGGRADWDVYYVPIDPETGLETGSPGPVPRANDDNFEHGVEWGN